MAMKHGDHIRLFERKYYIVLFLGIVSISWTAQAQDDSFPSFNSIRTPTSPAFVLLGIEPTAVERPNTPSALAVSILNRTQNLSVLPKDYALEFSPYWLLGHSELTWRQDTMRSIDGTAKYQSNSGALPRMRRPNQAMAKPRPQPRPPREQASAVIHREHPAIASADFGGLNPKLGR